MCIDYESRGNAFLHSILYFLVRLFSSFIRQFYEFLNPTLRVSTALIKGMHVLTEVKMPPFPVYCSAGQHIVVQRRSFPFDMSFNRTWDEYKNGFGDLNGEFWLGLEKLYRILNQPYVRYSVRIETWSESGNLWFEEFENFYIGDENEQYEIKSTGSHGNLNFQSYFNYGGKFFTHDKDSNAKCGFLNNGFWYSMRFSGVYECSRLLLNANVPIAYNTPGTKVSTELKIRPIGV